ncbi:MAG: prolipoprotein diacylglyceryl transferase family protein [Gemmatimonadota bacterium]
MLPYVEQPIFQLGPLTVHAFGIAVACAALWGMWSAERQFRRRALDLSVGTKLATWVLIAGVFGAHLFSVLFYFPDKLRADPWLLLRVWEDISSFGGILGGVAGALLYFNVGPGREHRARQWDYLGTIARIFPASLAIGRFGCALAHDHPGTVTTFPLAFSIRTEAALAYITGVYRQAGVELAPVVSDARDASAVQGFHDLGWYEFLFLALVIVPLFQLWGRRDRPGGFYLVAFPLLYLPVRFGLDFLRVADVRYAGLTPAQWVAVVAMVGLGVVLVERSRRGRSALRGV